MRGWRRRRPVAKATLMPNTAGEEARRRLGRRKQDGRREQEGKRRGRWRRRLVTDRWIGLASLHLEASRVQGRAKDWPCLVPL